MIVEAYGDPAYNGPRPCGHSSVEGCLTGSFEKPSVRSLILWRVRQTPCSKLLTQPCTILCCIPMSFAYKQIHEQRHMRECIRMSVCMYACMHACMHVCVYVCMYVCVHIHTFIHMCIYIYVYTHVRTYMYLFIYLFIYEANALTSDLLSPALALTRSPALGKWPSA